MFGSKEDHEQIMELNQLIIDVPTVNKTKKREEKSVAIYMFW